MGRLNNVYEFFENFFQGGLDPVIYGKLKHRKLFEQRQQKISFFYQEKPRWDFRHPNYCLVGRDNLDISNQSSSFDFQTISFAWPHVLCYHKIFSAWQSWTNCTLSFGSMDYFSRQVTKFHHGSILLMLDFLILLSLSNCILNIHF